MITTAFLADPSSLPGDAKMPARKVGTETAFFHEQLSSQCLVSTLTPANAAATVNAPAPGVGLTLYITEIEVIRLNPTAAAVAAAAVALAIVAVGLAGINPTWTIANAIAAGGYDVPVRVVFPHPKKAAAPNAAVGIQVPAAGAGVQFQVNIYGYAAA